MLTVSVVPNYNHARYLRKRIASVLDQTYQDFEVVLLTTSRPMKAGRLLASTRVIRECELAFNEKNSGTPFKQWNKDVQMARGRNVRIAESDDYANARLLERLVAVLDAEPAAAFVSCRSLRVSADDRLDGFADSYFAHMDPNEWTMDFCADSYEYYTER